jgi:HAE1 family hydrophobic/amphiphilic exporter-1
MLAIALFGVVAYRSLPVSDLPNVDFPTLVVNASLPGASPETMASAVATPLERQFSTIPGLDSMISSSALGVTSVTLQFELSRNLDGAATDVQTAITQASPLLPPGMPSPPYFRKVNPADQPILYIAVASPTLPMWEVDEYAETIMAQRISMVSGVAQVLVQGAQKYAVHAQVDPRLMAAKQIGINEVEDALRNWNVLLPTGSLWGTHNTYTVLSNGQLDRAAQYQPMIVAYRNGAPVRLQDIGRAIDSVEDDKTASWHYHKIKGARRAISLQVQRQPGTNTVEVANAVKALLPVFRSQIPSSVDMSIVYDRSQLIREGFKDVQFTMLLTLGLVVMVIFLFLRNISATAIPSLALPFSIVGTFAVMYLMDFSLDQLSMMALILCIGFVVDDAIVMLENIVRHMEHGARPMEAAFAGSREIGFTIVSMTLSLAAVFIPVLFMGGILGRLFREFAVTICVAILISGFVSISLTPMLCSCFLRPPSTDGQGRFYRVTQKFFDGMLNVYDVTLRWVLRYRPATMGVFFVILAATIYLFIKIPKGFIPEQDTDSVFTIVEAAQGTSFEQMKQYQQAVARVAIQDPNIQEFNSTAGGSFAGLAGPNFGRMFFHLVPRAKRQLDVNQVMAELRPKLSQFPGVRVFMQNPPTIRIGGQLTKSLYQFTMQSPDSSELYQQAPIMEREIARLPGLREVTSDLLIKNPQLNVIVDRDKAAALKLNVNQVENALYDAFGMRWVSTIYAPSNQYRVLLELLPKYQADPDTMSLLYLRSGDGKLVPLDTLATLVKDIGPQSIAHYGQFPAVTVSFNLAPGYALGDAVSRIGEVASRVLSPAISTTFQGSAKAFQDSLKNLSVLLVVAIMVVYIVLGILYESFIHPLTILSGLPSAGFGALLTLYLFHIDLNIYAFVGLIMLIGIVKKNAIMQIDFALSAERTEGMKPMDAIYKGCLTRFRPIMMTTMAALLGAVPIAVGYGSGGEARRPLGLCVVGGLLFSQLVTLYLTPVIYTYLAALTMKRGMGNGRPVLKPSPKVLVHA